VAEGFHVSVPATSANLGPGFDAIGLALDLRVEADVAPASHFSISFDGGSIVPTNAGFETEIVRGIARVIGDEERPCVAIRVRNDVPLGKGLGASAAGAVLGVTIGAQLVHIPPAEAELARIVCELEGHPDNAMPALLGGVVVAAMSPGASPTYLRFDPPPATVAVVATPHIVLPTAAARALLPPTYARADVVFNIQRAALLAAAFACGDVRALRVAAGDRVHQPYRAPLVPGFAEMLAFDVPGLYAVALSGAGPSVIALADPTYARAVGAAMHAAFAREDIRSDVRVLAVTARGASVDPLGAPPRSG